jgi:uncharacterized phage infection (PIP) family protein YhgE
LVLTDGNETATTTGTIKDVPEYKLSPEDYQAYHEWMSNLEAEVTSMHSLVNTAKTYEEELSALLKKIEGKTELLALHTKANQLIQELKIWDEEMVQRKSTAYDDVENFPNKFTANFLFMMNHGESSIPKINQATQDRYAELILRWRVLEAEGKRLIEKAIPEFNKIASELGIGVLNIK